MNEFQSRIHIRIYTQRIESITLYASSFIVKFILRENRIECILHIVPNGMYEEHYLDDSLCTFTMEQSSVVYVQEKLVWKTEISWMEYLQHSHPNQKWKDVVSIFGMMEKWLCNCCVFQIWSKFKMFVWKGQLLT